MVNINTTTTLLPIQTGITHIPIYYIHYIHQYAIYTTTVFKLLHHNSISHQTIVSEPADPLPPPPQLTASKRTNRLSAPNRHPSSDDFSHPSYTLSHQYYLHPSPPIFHTTYSDPTLTACTVPLLDEEDWCHYGRDPSPQLVPLALSLDGICHPTGRRSGHHTMHYYQPLHHQ